MNKEETRQKPSDDNSFKIIGVVQPWESSLTSQVRIETKNRRTGKEIVKETRADDAGIFVLTLDSVQELKTLLKSGDIEIKAIDRNNKVLGKSIVGAYEGKGPIAIKLHNILPGFKKSNISSDKIISESNLKHLARKLAKLQQVEMLKVRAPRLIVKAIQELNQISQLAARSLAGDKSAEKLQRELLSASAFDSPGGAPKGIGQVGSMVEMGLLDVFAENQIGGYCGPLMKRLTNVLDSAFKIDLKERNQNARWTRQTWAYVRSRMQDAAAYTDSVNRAADEFRGSQLFDVPMDGGEFSSPFFPELGEGFPPVPGPDFEEPGLSPCEQLADLCIGLYVETMAAAALDEYVDLIGQVTPNCLCSGAVDPNQVYVATPAANRLFPNRPPIGVSLYFRDQVREETINWIQWTSREIHFRLPPRNPPEYYYSGSIYLRALAVAPSQASRRLAAACGNLTPVIPHEILMDRSPAAFISIIYPPVIDFIRANVSLPAKACTAVSISWRAHLSDQLPGSPIYPCGSIEVILRDDRGNQVAVGGASGSVTESRAEDATYILEAVSRAGQTLCGNAAPVALAIPRVKLLSMDRDVPMGTEIQNGASGSFDVRISCPAPAGGLSVQLAPDNPVLQVQSSVTIPEGSNTLLVNFTATTTDPALACSSTFFNITATAVNHTLVAPLQYQIYEVPSIQWADMAAPTNILEGDALLLKIDTTCVPEDPARSKWWLIEANASGNHPLSLSVRSQSGQYPAMYFELTLNQPSALTPGNWQVVVEIPDRGNLRSAALAFVVNTRPSFTISISPLEQTVEWGGNADFTVAVEGQNFGGAQVTLATDLSIGFEPTFSPRSVSISSNARVQSRLSVIAHPGKTPFGRTPPFNVSGSATNFPPANLQAPKPVIIVRRSQVSFNPKDVTSSDSSCNNINAMVSGDGQTQTVTFASPALPRSITEPMGFYLISPQCNSAIVVPPMRTEPGRPAPDHGAPALKIFNLGFDITFRTSPLSRLRPGDKIWEYSPVFWQRFYFSPDESLLVIVGRNRASIGTHVAMLIDMVIGDLIQELSFSPAIIESPDDPSPLLPGETTILLAAITSVVSGRNNMNQDIVTVNFTDTHSVADSLELHW